jgi:hypothetical protein
MRPASSNDHIGTCSSESALQIVALARKNSLFFGHEQAARNFSVLYSLVQTAERHGVKSACVPRRGSDARANPSRCTHRLRDEGLYRFRLSVIGSMAGQWCEIPVGEGGSIVFFRRGADYHVDWSPRTLRYGEYIEELAAYNPSLRVYAP